MARKAGQKGSGKKNVEKEEEITVVSEEPATRSAAKVKVKIVGLDGRKKEKENKKQRAKGLKKTKEQLSTIAIETASHMSAADGGGGDDDMKRSYDLRQYWEARYAHDLGVEPVLLDEEVGSAGEKTSAKGGKRSSGSGSTSSKGDKKAVVATDIVRSAADSDVTKEWYYSYAELQPLFAHHLPNRKYLKQNADVLDIGCGLSTLFADLRADGWEGKMVGIDYSDSLINHLNQTLKKSPAPGVQYVHGDARAMSMFADNQFQLVMDKATSDGLLCGKSAATTPLLYAEVARVLAPGGCFVIMSVNDPDHGWFREYVMETIVKACPNNSWRVAVHSSGEDDEDRGPNVYVLHKCPQRLRTRAAKRTRRSKQGGDEDESENEEEDHDQPYTLVHLFH